MGGMARARGARCIHIIMRRRPWCSAKQQSQEAMRYGARPAARPAVAAGGPLACCALCGMARRGSDVARPQLGGARGCLPCRGELRAPASVWFDSLLWTVKGAAADGAAFGQT